MKDSLNWLLAMNFKPSWEPSKELGESVLAAYGRFVYGSPLNTYITVPGLPSYMPPMIPATDGWHDKVAKMTQLSFLTLIADIWTALLAGKRDSKERPIYLFWDDEVPKPSPLTSLAWLLTCESWPMPSHRDVMAIFDSQAEGPNLDAAFPPQPFLLPQSTPLGSAGSQPPGFSRGYAAQLSHRNLNSSFIESLHRGDRENMALVANYAPVHRPPARNATGYGFHESEGFERRYGIQTRWPRATTQAYDQGLAAHELQESVYHHQALMKLRAEVMSGVLVQPGLPTHKNTLYSPPGMSIRNWSERGLGVTHPITPLFWTPQADSVSLEHGTRMPTIPLVAPRVWFGFTHLGPNSYGPIMDGDTLPSRVETASERWAQAYLKHRTNALKMLFDPDSINVEQLIDDTTAARAKLLERASRIKAKQEAKGNGFAAAFANVTKKQENQE